VALRPLSSGRHRIHFTGSIPADAPDGTSTTIDVTYVLRVSGRT
jgi:hypothetical protein